MAAPESWPRTERPTPPAAIRPHYSRRAPAADPRSTTGDDKSAGLDSSTQSPHSRASTHTHLATALRGSSVAATCAASATRPLVAQCLSKDSPVARTRSPARSVCPVERRGARAARSARLQLDTQMNAAVAIGLATAPQPRVSMRRHSHQGPNTADRIASGATWQHWAKQSSRLERPAMYFVTAHRVNSRQPTRAR